MSITSCSSGRITKMIAQNLSPWKESEKHAGSWWPAERRELIVDGVLEFEDRRPRLMLMSPLIGQRIFDLAHAQVVHGELESGEKVTLWDFGGHVLEFLGNEHDSMKTARRFTYAILGAHLEAYEEERFRYSAYTLHGLGVWSAMDTPIPRNLSGEDLPQYEPAHLNSFERDESGVEYSATVYIENPRRLEADARFPEGAVVAHTGDDARIVFECDPPAPAQIHDLLLFDLQALLTFSYQGGAPLQAEWLASEDMDQALPVMRWDSFTGRRPTGHVFRQSMILDTALVDPTVLFPAWWNAVKKLYPAPQVVTLYHHGSRGILESSVSSVIAVAEHLHGQIGPTLTRFPEGFLESKKGPLKETFPSPEDAPFREFLYQALKNNRPTLSTRLNELASAVKAERLKLMTISEDQWIADVRKVRDLLAHTSSHVTRRGGDGDSSLLDRVNSQTRAIVTILILKQMGIGETALDRAATALSAELKRFAIEGTNT